MVKKTFNLNEAANHRGVTRQSVYISIKNKKLASEKKGGRWVIHEKDIEEFEKQRYSRAKSTYNGELVYDKKKGEYSVTETAKLLNVPKQHVYYALRNDFLKSIRKNFAWVINIDDIQRYKKQLRTAL